MSRRGSSTSSSTANPLHNEPVQDEVRQIPLRNGNPLRTYGPYVCKERTRKLENHSILAHGILLRAPMDTCEIWKRGILLQNAWYRFANPEQQARYQELSKSHNPGACLQRILDGVSEFQGDEAGKWQYLSEATSAEFSVMSDHVNLLKKQVLHWQRNGTLLAYGFQQPRGANDTPVRVPEDIWDGRVDWNQSKVSSGSLVIEAVRLIYYKHAEQHQGLIQKDKQRPGRPTRRPQIMSAYGTLKDSGQIDFAGSLGDHYAAIRRQVLSENPTDPSGEKGLGNEAIRRTLRDIFEEDQSHHL